MAEIKTARLLLRHWRSDDFSAFAKMTADSRVMEYFPSVLTEQESNGLAQRISDKLDENDWGFWAVSIPGVADFIGFIGLNQVTFEAPFTPATEIGWRLAYDFWGQGYASEGARAALQYGFETLHLNEIVSFTAVANTRSRHVMEKIGMHHNPEDDFDHPKVSVNSPVRRHVLYRIQSYRHTN